MGSDPLGREYEVQTGDPEVWLYFCSGRGLASQGVHGGRIWYCLGVIRYWEGNARWNDTGVI